MGQIIGEDFAKFCGLLRICELYIKRAHRRTYIKLLLIVQSKSSGLYNIQLAVYVRASEEK